MYASRVRAAELSSRSVPPYSMYERKTDRVQINALNHSPTVWVQCPLGPRHSETRVRGSLKGKKNRILEGGAGAGSRTGGMDGWDNRDRSPSVFRTIPNLRRLQADLGCHRPSLWLVHLDERATSRFAPLEP